MEGRVRAEIVRAAVVVALGVGASFVTSAAIASQAYVKRGKVAAETANEITVKGSARIRVRSDLATWRIRVLGEGRDLRSAFEGLEAAATRVTAFLRERGFRDEEVALSAIETTTHHERDREGRETRVVSGYTLERSVSVRTPEVDRVGAAAGEVTGLLREGVPVASGTPEYLFSKAADLKVQILGEASRDARVRAEQIAANAGFRVGEVRKAQMGVIQILAPDSTEVTSYGTYDTGTRDKDVFVVVTVTFSVL
jgi:hypothetical protein